MDTALVLPRIEREICTGRGDCIEVCHADALVVQNLKAVIIRPDACDYCTDCETVCPASAIACPLEVIIAG